MARYIDADALIEALQADFDREGAKADDMAMRGLADVSVKYSHGQFCFLNAIEQVKITPTADVVPKSEVDWNSIPVDVSEALKQRAVEKAKTEVAREIFEEIERLMENNEVWFRQTDEIREDFSKLKKKYTGG